MLDRTKAKENWQGKRVLVLGMARSGIAVAQLLCRESFDVTVCPQGDLARQFD